MPDRPVTMAVYGYGYASWIMVLHGTAAARRRAYNHMDALGITAVVIIVFFIPQVDPIGSRLRKHLAF